MLSWLRRLIQTKALTTPLQPVLQGFGARPGGRRIDFAQAVGDGMDSSVVMAPVMWVARTFPEAPLAVYKLGPKGARELLPNHPLARLVTKPNDAYGSLPLWMATLVSWCIYRQRYWIIVRDARCVP